MSSEYLFQAIDQLTAAVEALSAKLNSQDSQALTINVDCCPQPIYDCETGEVKWVYPPKRIGGSGSVEVAPKDAVDGIILIGDEYVADETGDFGERVDDVGYDTTTPPAEVNICDNANWFVYQFSNLLRDADSTAGIFFLSIDGYIGVLAKYGFLGAIPLVIGGAAEIVLSIPTATIIGGYYLFKKLLSLLGAGVGAKLNTELEQDLVCAIVVGSQGGGKGIKDTWDNTINTHIPALNPLRWYYKYLLHRDMANALASGVLPAGTPKYGYGCDCVQVGGTWVLTSSYIQLSNGSETRWCHCIIFPNTEPFLPTSSVGSWYTVGGAKIFPTGAYGDEFEFRYNDDSEHKGSLIKVLDNGTSVWNTPPLDWEDAEYPAGFWLGGYTRWGSPGVDVPFTLEIREKV